MKNFIITLIALLLAIISSSLFAGAPQNFTAVVSGSTINFSWTPVGLSDTCAGDPCTFKIYYLRQTGRGNYYPVSTNRNQSTFVLNGLAEGEYEFDLIARYEIGPDDGSGFVSPKITVSIEPPAPPPLPPIPNPEDLITSSEITLSDEAGAIKGAIDISSSGAAQYQFSLLKMSGINGLSPELALSYNSQSGNGVMGLGWNISGLSAISRCRKTLQQDGVAKPITLSNEDQFCLDGQRLLRQPDGTYHPETDSLTKVTRIGSLFNPDYFTVDYKDGTTARYGSEGSALSEQTGTMIDGSVSDYVFSWGVERYSDSVGNFIFYNYQNPESDHLISNISYGYHRGPNSSSSQDWTYRISFFYEARKDKSTAYLADRKFVKSKRLKTISFTSQEDYVQTLRSYKITYNEGHSQVSDKISRVTSIQECRDQICSQPTQFTWQLPSIKYDSSAKSINLNTDSSSALKLTPGDFNGDGLVDVAWIQSNGQLRYALSQQGQLTHATFANNAAHLPINLSSWHYNTEASVVVVDYNGDGRDDLAVRGSGTNDNWLVYLSLPQGDGTWKISSSSILANIPGDEPDAFVSFNDMDGDGLTDAFYAPLVMNHALKSYRLEENQNGSSSQTPFSFVPQNQTPFLRALNAYTFGLNYEVSKLAGHASGVADFNGDGVRDLIAYDSNIQYSCSRSTEGNFIWDTHNGSCANSAGYVPYVKESVKSSDLSSNVPEGIYYKPYGILDLSHQYWKSGKFRLIDINGDGLTDIAYLEDKYVEQPSNDGLGGDFTYGGGDWFYVLNTGYGFSEQKLLVSSPNPTNYDSVRLLPAAGGFVRHDNQAQFEDVNQDGYPDFIYFNFQQVLTQPYVETNQLMIRYWNPETSTFLAAQPYCPKGASNCNATYDQFILSLGLAEFPTLNNFHFWDVNGDGRNDHVYYRNDRLDVYLSESTPNAVNTITKIENGYGGITEFFYSVISNTDHYAKMDVLSGSTCGDAAECWRRDSGVDSSSEFYSKIREPFTGNSYAPHSLGKLQHANFVKTGIVVVTDVKTSSPTSNPQTPGAINNSSKRTTQHYYSNARIQAAGRGFLGFEKVQIIDDQTGIATIRTYRQDWPFIGHEAELTKVSSSGSLIEKHSSIWKINGWLTNFPSSAKSNGTASLGPIQSYLSQTVQNTYALSDNGDTQGPLLKRFTKTTQSIDEYMNVTNQSETIHNGDEVLIAEKTTGLTYGLSSWQKERGLIATMHVTEARGSTSETRNSSFTYWTSGSLQGLLRSETLEPGTALSLTTTYIHDSDGNVIQKNLTDASGNTRTGKRAEFESRGRYVRYVLENFSNSTGGPAEYLFQNITYDLYGNVWDEKRRIDGSTWLLTKHRTSPMGYMYFKGDDTGSYTISTRHLGNAAGLCPSGTAFNERLKHAGGQQEIHCFDTLERNVRSAIIGFDGRWVFTDSEYNNFGLLARKSEPYFQYDSVFWEEYQYDILGRVVSIDSNKSGLTQYDYVGYTTTVTNEANSRRIETKDALGLTKKIESDNGFFIAFSHDAAGRVAGSVDSDGNAIVVNHNKLGQKLNILDPNAGLSHFTYTGFGELKTTTDAIGNVITNTYDFKGRIKTRTDKNNLGQTTANVVWTYDLTAHGLGQIAKVSDSSSSYQEEYSYDIYGRRVNLKTSLPGKGAAIENHFEKMEFDAVGRVNMLYDAARSSQVWTSNAIKYTYNDFGFLQKISDGITSAPYQVIESMDARGNIENSVYGNNVLHSIEEYNSASGLLETQKATSSSLLVAGRYIQDREYEWNEIGNLSHRIVRGLRKNGSSFALRSLREDFSYDNMNRLKTYAVSGGSTVSIDYHLNGNIKRKTDASTSDYSYGSARPHAVTQAGGVTYTYDSVGNLKSDGTGRSLLYSAANQLASVSHGGRTVKYVYSPDRKVVRREDISSAGKVVTLSVGSVEKQYYPDGTYTWKRYIGKNVLISQKFNSAGSQLSNLTQYLLHDHLGSLSHVVSSDGTPLDILDFDPWGKRRNPVNFSTLSAAEIQGKYFLTSKPYTSKSFTGHEAIDESGLIHMKGRVYNPILGVFIQADPLVEDVKSTQAFNRYSYVQNNPLNATDPTGMNSDREKVQEAEKIPEDILVKGTRPLLQETSKAYKAGEMMVIAAILVGNTAYGAFYSFDPGTGVISNVTYATAQATKNFISYTKRRGGSFVNLSIRGAANTKSAENTEGQSYSGEQERWGTANFVKHYFFGGAKEVNLGDVGLGEDFRNTSQVQRAEAALKLSLELELRTSETDTVQFRDKFFLHNVGENNITNPLFSLGNGWLNMDAICSGGSCQMRFHYSDYFREPLDIKNIEVRGGTPYPIKYHYDGSM